MTNKVFIFALIEIHTSMIEMMRLAKLHNRLKTELSYAIDTTISKSQFIKGEPVTQFENELSKYLNTNVCTCANGTDALLLALKALNLSEGDEVITTTMSFVSAAEVCATLRLHPIFVDVEGNTMNMDPADIERTITQRTKAIIATHLFGRPCKMEEIMHIAQKHNIPVIEDVAQAMGGSAFIDGHEQKLGTIGAIGCTSFFPSKNIGCMGDGGAVFSANEQYINNIRTLANHGCQKKYYHEVIGLNSRLDGLQAAILSVKLKYLDSMNNARHNIALKYIERLKECKHICIPDDDKYHVYHQFTIRIPNNLRNNLKDFLLSKEIKSMIYYPLMLHLQPIYAHYCNRELPISEALQDEVLSLPIDSELTDIEVDKICNTIIEWDKRQ